MDKDMDTLKKKYSRLVVQCLAMRYEIKKLKKKLDDAEAHRALIREQLTSWGKSR